jgi:chromosome segregation ATPase
MSIPSIVQEQPSLREVENFDLGEKREQSGRCACRYWRAYPASICSLMNGALATIAFISLPVNNFAYAACLCGSALCHAFSSRQISRQVLGKSFADTVHDFSRENREFGRSGEELAAYIRELEATISHYESGIQQGSLEKKELLARLESSRLQQQNALDRLEEAARSIAALQSTVAILKERQQEVSALIAKWKESNHAFAHHLEELDVFLHQTDAASERMERQTQELDKQNDGYEESNRRLAAIVEAIKEQSAQIERFFSLNEEKLDSFSRTVEALDQVDDQFAIGAKELRDLKQKEVRSLQEEVDKLNQCLDVLAQYLVEIDEQNPGMMRQRLQEIKEKLLEYKEKRAELQRSTARLQRQRSFRSLLLLQEEKSLEREKES